MTHLDPSRQQRLVLQAQAGDRQALERLLHTNKALIAHWAHRYTGRGLELEELMQEGQTGMIKAVERYRTGRKASFPTYASLWVRQAMGRACESQGSLNRFGMRLPSDVCNAFPHIGSQRRDFSVEQARRISQQGPPQELEEARGMQAGQEISHPLIRSILSQGCGHMEEGFQPDMLCLHGSRIGERAYSGSLSESEWFLVSRPASGGWKLEVMVEERWLELSQAAGELSGPGLESLLSLSDDLALVPRDNCTHC